MSLACRRPLERVSLDGPGVPESKDALARKDLEAVEDSLCATFSRDVGGGRWKGVADDGAAILGSESESEERTLGVEVIVPHVMSLFTAAGPNCDAVGEGSEGRRGKSARSPRGT